MPSKRRIAQTTLFLSGAALLTSGILGALEVPTGLNIAVALTITLALLVEMPLTAMAIAKYKSRSR